MVMIPSYLYNAIPILVRQHLYIETTPDSLASSGARASACTIITKFGPYSDESVLNCITIPNASLALSLRTTILW